MSCDKTDCAFHIETPMGDSHAKCHSCKNSDWKPKSKGDNYKNRTQTTGDPEND